MYKICATNKVKNKKSCKVFYVRPLQLSIICNLKIDCAILLHIGREVFQNVTLILMVGSCEHLPDIQELDSMELFYLLLEIPVLVVVHL